MKSPSSLLRELLSGRLRPDTMIQTNRQGQCQAEDDDRSNDGFIHHGSKHSSETSRFGESQGRGRFAQDNKGRAPFIGFSLIQTGGRNKDEVHCLPAE